MSYKLFGQDDNTGTNNSTTSMIANKWTSTVSGIMSEFRLKSGANSNVRGALYTDNAGVPGTVIASFDSTACTTGWNTISFPNTNIVSGTTYWLAALCETTGGTQYIVYSGSAIRAYTSMGYGDAWPTAGFSTQDNYSDLLTAWGEINQDPKCYLHARRDRMNMLGVSTQDQLA